MENCEINFQYIEDKLIELERAGTLSVQVVNGGPTLSLNSALQYCRDARGMEMRWLHQRQHSGISRDHFLSRHCRTLAPASVRRIKAAWRMVAKFCGHEDPSTVFPNLLAVRTQYRPGDDGRRRSSARKRKSCSEKDFLKIIAAIEDLSESTYKDLTLCMLVATRFFGARSGEWNEYEFFEGESGSYPLVRITNLKRTNGRAHGYARTVRAEVADEPTLAAVRSLKPLLFEAKRNANGSIEAVMAGVRRCIRTANKRAFPRRYESITLHTLRHQVVANLKAAGVPPEEIAQIMGHASDQTAATNYQTARWGAKCARCPSADPFETLRVRRSYASRRERFNNRFLVAHMEGASQSFLEGPSF